MLKKLVAAFAVMFTMAVCASAAGTIFPAARTDMDGITRYGYLDEAGQTVLPFAYNAAGDFAECGLAAVEDNKWQTALIDRTGRLVVPYTAAPVSVEFSADAAAYRYADRSVYYTVDGKEIGSYVGAEGFFSDGLLKCKSPASGLYRYVKEDGEEAFPGAFKKAGAFSDGRALVQTEDNAYVVIDTAGTELMRLPAEIIPAYMSIYGTDTIVVSGGTTYALYSLSKGYLTDFLYAEISEFHEGAAMVRQINRWGMIDTNGKLLTEPTYYYLSYMGEGLYAARSQDGSAAAVDADGNVAYRTGSFVGGFKELRYGLSWHGMADGGLIFFRKNGGYYASLKNAEDPLLLSDKVVRVKQDGEVRYINLDNGQVLFTPPTSFALGQGLVAKTVHYEKFMGYQADGSEHGWNVSFPEIDGLPDTDMQKKINTAIRDFFLKGPSVTAEYDALEGGYGVSLEGSVLVVSASCVSGKGEGSSIWNNSLAFDLNTGDQYKIGDLLKGDYSDVIRGLLPEDHPIYLYSYPRMSVKGVTYYFNEYQSDTRRAYTDTYLLTFEQLGDVVDRQGDCWMALQTPYRRPDQPLFSDVPETHWAYAVVTDVVKRGLMQGANGSFKPDQPITYAEMCATVARLEKLETPKELLPTLNAAAWYADEVTAVANAGLLSGLEQGFTPDAPATRADAMQMFANLLLKKQLKAPSAEEVDTLLKPFVDAADLSEARRDAAALCVREELVSGSGGKLTPNAVLTRAEFAKLLLKTADIGLNAG